MRAAHQEPCHARPRPSGVGRRDRVCQRHGAVCACGTRAAAGAALAHPLRTRCLVEADWPCPFCSLRCDGVAIEARPQALVLHGAADPVAPDDAMLAFENDLRTAPSVDWQLVSYANAMHAFTLPDADAPEQGAQFQATAERRSWAAMKAFLAEVFG